MNKDELLKLCKYLVYCSENSHIAADKLEEKMGKSSKDYLQACASTFAACAHMLYTVINGGTLNEALDKLTTTLQIRDSKADFEAVQAENAKLELGNALGLLNKKGNGDGKAN